MQEEFKQISEEYARAREEFKDPVAIGLLLTKIAGERSSYNLLVREINAKLERLEKRMVAIEKSLQKPVRKAKEVRVVESGMPLLSDIDSDIMDFVEEKGNCCAEDVQEKFKYKGKNAASSRLNRLAKDGLLEKMQVGRKVFFRKSR
jgi:uncharacterized membrane protein